MIYALQAARDLLTDRSTFDSSLSMSHCSFDIETTLLHAECEENATKIKSTVALTLLAKCRDYQLY